MVISVLLSYRLRLILRYDVGMGLQAILAELNDAGCSIGTKNQPEQLGDEIVELFAVSRVGKLTAIGAGGVVIVDAALADGAGRELWRIKTTGAAIAKVCPAGPAIQATSRYQFRVGHNWFHVFIILAPLRFQPFPLLPATR